MFNRASLLVLALAAAPGALASQQRVLPSVPQTLSLNDAVTLATRYNPNLRQRENDRGGAAWGVRNAYANLFLPSLGGNFRIGYTGPGSQTFLDTRFEQPSGQISSGYGLNLSWQLNGNILMQPAVQKAALHATDATIEGERVTMATQVTGLYLAVLQSQAQVEISRAEVARTEEALRLAQARQQVGQATMLDVRQAEFIKGQADVNALRSQQNVTLTKLQLFQQMGVPAPDDPSVVTLSDTFPVTQPTWSLTDLLADAQSSNPSLNALRAQESSARWSARSAKSQWLPTLSFNAGWQGFTQQYTNAGPVIEQRVAGARLQGDATIAQCEFINQSLLNPGLTGPDCSTQGFTADDEAELRAQLQAANSVFPFNFTRQPFSAGISLSFPIFDGFDRNVSVSRANAQADDARESVRSAELNVRTQVSQMYYNLLTSYQTIAIQQTNRIAAGEALRLATERYRVGSGTFVDLLQAQSGSQSAETGYINAVYDYHRAVAALENAVGRSLR